MERRRDAHDRTVAVVRRRARHLPGTFLNELSNAAPLRLGRYELLARIATGGMGEIFLARLEGAAGFEKLYVIKRILPHLASDSRFRAMLIGEARIAARMSHANICQVYELAESDHQLYIVMEYLEGITLLALLRKYAQQKRKLPFGFIAGVVHQVAEGLHYAHDLRDRNGNLMGIVHRDVTPSNLFLTESGIAKVHDFGVAKAKDSTTTESGAVKGKFAYMAPEQLAGHEVDRRADVFALGVVITEMISGRRLFQRKTDYLTFQAVMELPLPDFRRHRPELPEGMVAVLTRALVRDPADRFATVRELDDAVSEGLGRPWSQAEISALIGSDFGEELQRHHSEVSGVIHRSSPRIMPTILESPSDPDAESYATFETSMASGGSALSAPSAIPQLAERLRTQWKLVAAVAGAVLLVVLALATHGFHGSSPPTSPLVISATGPLATYGEAIRARNGELARCLASHDDAVPDGAQAVVRIGVDGHPRQVSFTPAEVERSGLAGCLRDVLTATVFPPGAEREIALGVVRR
jgi:serine/threonine protein kinase